MVLGREGFSAAITSLQLIGLHGIAVTAGLDPYSTSRSPLSFFFASIPRLDEPCPDIPYCVCVMLAKEKKRDWWIFINIFHTANYTFMPDVSQITSFLIPVIRQRI